MTSLFSLNHDVLCVLVSFLSSADAITLSSTGRKVHYIARQHALSSVTSTNPDHFERFCAFALADVPNRLYWLHDLKISKGAFRLQHKYMQEQFSPSSAALLADLLERATNLRRLSVAGIEALLVAEPRVGDALISLRELCSLELHDIAAGGLHVISHLQSRPRALALRHASEHGVGDGNLFHHIAPLQSLQHLELSRFYGISLGLIDPLQQWPDVHHLTLIQCSPQISTLALAFPNLRSLRMQDVRRSLSRYIIPMVDDGTCWPELDRVSAIGRDMYGWPSACPVYWLQLEQSLFPKQELQNASPVVLSLLYCNCSVNPDFWCEIVEATPRLKCIDLVMMTTLPQLSLWMKRVLSILGRLNLVCVRIVLVNWDVGNHDVCDTAQFTPDKGIFEAVASTVASSIPSIRYICTGLGTRAECGADAARSSFGYITTPLWWKAVEASGARTAQPIPLSLGERVLADVRSPACDFGRLDPY